MALERKPVEETQEPGYPSTDEYVTGRRAFIGLLGLTALGVGGVYMLKANPSGNMAGESPPVRSSAGNQVPMPGKPPSVQPPPAGQTSLPKAAIGGEVAAPQLTPSSQLPAPKTDPSGKLPPPELIQPEAPAEGGVKPVRPQAQLDGDVMAPELPARPETRLKGDVAPVRSPEIRSIDQRDPQPPAQPEAATGGKPMAPTQPKP
jgi:hypothetical protein